MVVETSLGTAYAWVHPARRRRATLVLGHGAGRGSDTADLLGLAAALPAHGVEVVRVDQPWVVAGRRLAPAPATLDRAWLEVVGALPAARRLLLGGRSAGARVACRTGAGLRAAGTLALAFPLHRPGRPERSRAGELGLAVAPLLVVQGERDAFGRPDELRAALPAGAALAAVAGADHALRAGLPAEVVERVAVWARG
ncbi:hypothetical protein CLV35_3199 [Motilibacter peucedani]|uniref:KANL3/Tex30 alpha/beta hydrolase-like domain-containing protein n=1 Tax=Motilibacter peucedani TaxID=598650 RepID=A0A420XM59_9ACTN|nr:alpha/beta family hydrolase [Motilibacter peucedani]RKS71401.1 hypothetical protein CLV35_3199 [Motilibacter peucedani]